MLQDKLPSLSFIHFVLMMIGMIHQFKREGLLVVIIWHEIMDLILESKSLQRSPTVGDFYRTGIEIWAVFFPIGSTEKPGSGSIMSNF